MKAECLDRLVHDHLIAGDREAGLGHRIGDVARGDRAEQLAHLRRGTNHADGKPVHLAGFGFGIRTTGKIICLTLGLFGFELLKIDLVGAKCLSLRQQVVACVAGLYRYDIAHLAELLDAFEQDDFHDLVSPSRRPVLRGHIWHQSQEP